MSINSNFDQYEPSDGFSERLEKMIADYYDNFEGPHTPYNGAYPIDRRRINLDKVMSDPEADEDDDAAQDTYIESVEDQFINIVESLRDRLGDILNADLTYLTFGFDFYKSPALARSPNSDIDNWHIDNRDDDSLQVFVAFGDVASIQCLRCDDLDISEELLADEMSDQLDLYLRDTIVDEEADFESIPNGVFVIMPKYSIHRRGPIIKPGLRVGIGMRFQKRGLG